MGNKNTRVPTVIPTIRLPKRFKAYDHIIISGGGPVALIFAANLMSHFQEVQLQNPPKIVICGDRWETTDDDDDDELRFSPQNRRAQVVTLQDNVVKKLPQDIQNLLREKAEVVWPNSINIALRDVEDLLLRHLQQPRFQQWITFSRAARPTPKLGDSVTSCLRNSLGAEQFQEWLDNTPETAQNPKTLVVVAEGAQSMFRRALEKSGCVQLLDVTDKPVQPGISTFEHTHTPRAPGGEVLRNFPLHLHHNSWPTKGIVGFCTAA